MMLYFMEHIHFRTQPHKLFNHRVGKTPHVLNLIKPSLKQCPRQNNLQPVPWNLFTRVRHKTIEAFSPVVRR